MSCRICGKDYRSGRVCPAYHGEQHGGVCEGCCRKCSYHRDNGIYGHGCKFWSENPVKNAAYELNEAKRRERESLNSLDYCYDRQGDAMIAHANRRYQHFRRARIEAEAKLVREKRKAGLI